MQNLNNYASRENRVRGLSISENEKKVKYLSTVGLFESKTA